MVKAKILLKEKISTKFGVIIATPNHPAARFINNPERTLSHGLVKNLDINFNYYMIFTLV